MRRPENSGPRAVDEGAVSLEIDARGALCPIPVISLGRAARSLPDGSVIAVLADDPAAATDIPAWCRMKGADLLAADALPEGAARYLVKTGTGAAASAGGSASAAGSERR